MNINKRISIIRNEFKLTTRAFAEKLNISSSLITSMEKERRIVTNRTINDICREFNINENWLRYGKGSMLINKETITLDDYAKQKGATELDKTLMKAYLDIPPNERKKILSSFKAILNSYSLLDDKSDDILDNSTSNKDLQVPKNNEDVLTCKVARSTNKTLPQITKKSKEFIKKIENAPKVTSSDDL